ncbi:type VI secretion system protein ImpH [Silvimonas terrae]|uniref:Type VI secretion system protein ImpH n=1 Tax=Silvimonas terrae TaxID=300266 RepID=A0A840REH1_9NEIS|nr:type VI secretion system baseplate subunit TssG [Silvimonas terrae]MBB5190651.1 type VI secretion system protein ImpH [Silvimonas terrae]
MATSGRRPADSVAARLYSQTHAFEFGQALSVLQLLHPDTTPPGHGVDPRKETVRLTGPLSPVFAVSALGPLQAPVPGQTQPRLQVNLFGLGGPDGPLPYAWQEWLQARRMRKDDTPVAFLNLFHQRLLGQLNRVECKYRIAAPFSRPATSPVFPVLRALTGLLPTSLHDRQAVADAALLARTTILSNRRRSVSGFQMLVRGQFGMSIRVTQFDGGWSELPPTALTRLGRGASNNRLGRGALAGSKVWDEQAGLQLTLGPMTFEYFQTFLPGGARHQELMALATFYFGIDMRIRLNLRLQGSEVPRAILGSNARLGWTTWLSQPDTPPERQCRLAPGVETLS